MPGLQGYEIVKETVLKGSIPAVIGGAIVYAHLSGSPSVVFYAMVIFTILTILTIGLWVYEIHKRGRRFFT